jgi:hypothetical protein
VTVITLPVLAGAIHRVDGPGFQERIDLADRIHAAQPTLLYSVLVMRRFGATMVQIEVLIELLLVIFTAMKAVGGKRPVISEELQERCLARWGVVLDSSRVWQRHRSTRPSMMRLSSTL